MSRAVLPGGALRSLTGLRCPAAMLVFLSHIAYISKPYVPALRPASLGYLGVQMFFVLSGLVLAWGISRELDRVQFWWRRFTRIYPLHLAATALAVVVVAQPNILATIASLFLVQTWWPPWHDGGNAVSWSLCCEAFFYAIFPWLMSVLQARSPRQRWQLTAACYGSVSVILIGGSVLFGGRFDDPLHWQPLTNVPAFVIGAVIGLGLRDGWRPRVTIRQAWLVLAAVGSIVVAFRIAENGQRGTGIVVTLITPAFALLLLAYASADTEGRPTFFGSRALVYAGEVSFAFYLVHYTLMQLLTGPVGVAYDSATAAAGFAVISLILSVIVAVALHELVEKPIRSYLLNLRKLSPRPAIAPVVEELDAG